MKASGILGQRLPLGRALAVASTMLIAAVLVLGLGWKLASPTQGSVKRTHPASPVRAIAQSVPLSFEPNQGQTDPRVEFLARGAGYGLFLTSDAAVLKLQHLADKRLQTDAVHMQLAGSNPRAQVHASGQLPGESNYIIGNDPSKWHSRIPHYAQVTYQQVYPGIDLVYYGTQGQLEYDFRVAAGANPGAIQLSFKGQKTIEVESDGSVVLQTGVGDVRFHAPVAYQYENGAKRILKSRFVSLAADRVGFALDNYDHSRELVIDPVLSYSSYLGGSGDEACGLITGTGTPTPGCPAIALDSALNYYVAGSTTSADLPGVGSTALQQQIAGTANVFIAKFDLNNTLQFATYLGGSGKDTTAGVAADPLGNIYVAGSTTSPNFPTSNGVNDGPVAAGTHVFVSAIKADGTGLLYSTYLAGSGTDTASGLAIDGKGNAFAMGITNSVDSVSGTLFPTTPTGLQATPLSSTSPQFFVTEINITKTGASSLAYSTFFGGATTAGAAVVQGGGIAVDSSGNLYLTGGTNYLHLGDTTKDFPILNASQDCLDTPAVATAPNPPPTCSATATLPDAFVAKINPNAVGAASLLYSTYLGGNGTDIGYGIAVDSGLNVYVAGSTDSTNQFIPTGITPFQSTLQGSSDAFLAKLNNPAANTPVTATYFTYIGGGTTAGSAVAVDSTGNARVTGWTTGGFTAANNGGFNSGPGGGTDAFVARIDTSGLSTAVNFASILGGSSADHGTGIAVDPNFLTFVVGDTSSGDFPLAGSSFQGALKGGSDAFVSVLGGSSDLSISVTQPPPPPATQPTIGIGNPYTFRYTVTNNGPDPATGVVVTDNLPAASVTFGSITSSPGACASPSGTTVVCSIGNLATGGTATLSVTLTPTAASSGGFQNSAMVATTSPNTIDPKPANNTAKASVVATDFSLSASGPTPPSITAGQTATVNVTVTPVPTYPNNVSLTCSSGLPSQASCAFSTSTVTMTNTSPATSTLTISTTARPVSTTWLHHGSGIWYALLLPVSGITLLGAGVDSRRRKWLLAVCAAAVVGIVVFQAGCGSSSSSQTVTGGTPAGTYNIVITGTSGSVSRSQTVQLTVN